MAKEWKLISKLTPIEYTIQYVYNDGKATSTNPTTYTLRATPSRWPMHRR